MMTTVDAVVVGGGQAGLSVSHYLKQLSVHHVVLEQADKPGEAWYALSTQRWQSQLSWASALSLMLGGFATYATGIYPTAQHNLPHQADSAVAPADTRQS